MNQTAFAKNVVEQYNISAISDISGSPGVDLEPRKGGEPKGNREFPNYRALVAGVSCGCQSRQGLISRTNFAPAHVIAITPVYAWSRNS